MPINDDGPAPLGDRAAVVNGASVGEDHWTPNRSAIQVNHPDAPMADATKASINRLVDRDQPLGDVNRIAHSMP